MQQQEQLRTLREVAKRFSVSPWTIKRMLDRAEIQGIKIGRRWRVSEAEIRRILSNGTGKAAA